MYITKKCPNFLTLKLKRNTYLFKRDSYAAGSSRPCCEIRFPCYSSRWISLIDHPVYWREAVCKIFVLSSSSNTSSKLSDVNAFDPRCSSFMYPIGIRVVEVVHSELHVNFLKRIEYERFELDHNTLILYPERRIWKLVSSFLHREIYSWTEITTTKTIKKNSRFGYTERSFATIVRIRVRMSSAISNGSSIIWLSQDNIFIISCCRWGRLNFFILFQILAYIKLKDLNMKF